MIPNSKNSCAGNFSDWLEVHLINKCNGHCAWCVEKDGYHPKKSVSWRRIANQIIRHNATNIILLGGEPTLYKDLRPLIIALNNANKKIWITTNGSLLTPEFVKNNLSGIEGINISIHHYDLKLNEIITGVSLENLLPAMGKLQNVRFNCNCISGAIDSVTKIFNYIEFARISGANRVRFAELKNDTHRFVDLAKLFEHQYGLNDDPFIEGCNNDVKIRGFDVNFRQMCGLQTPLRPNPIDPQQITKKVLYYDGQFYDGWQKETKMEDKELIKILEDVASGKKSVAEAALLIDRKNQPTVIESTGGCQY